MTIGDRFDLIVPSLPGCAFSSRPARTGVNRADVAELCHTLMTGLGYERYGVDGADFGAGVATQLGLSHPDAVVGVHLSTTEVSPYLGPGAPPLTDAEQTYLAHRAEWDRTERGYSSVLSTRPPSLGYGLNDSPAGLAAPPPHNLTALPPTSLHSSTRCERRCVEYTFDIAHRPHGPTTRVTGGVVRPAGSASHT